MVRRHSNVRRRSARLGPQPPLSLELLILSPLQCPPRPGTLISHAIRPGCHLPQRSLPCVPAVLGRIDRRVSDRASPGS